MQRAHQVSLAEVPDQEFVAAMQAGQVKAYDFTQAPDSQSSQSLWDSHHAARAATGRWSS